MSPSRKPVPYLRAVPAEAPAEVSSEQVMAALHAGSPEFGRLLYSHLIRTVERTIVRVLGERGSDHEDLVQLVFEQVIQRAYRDRMSGIVHLQGWAAKVATHVSLNAIRSRRVDRRYFDRRGAFAEPEVRSTAESSTELALVRRTLAQMNLDQAEAVILHDVVGYEISEMARITGKSEAALQSRLVRGRKELQRLLALGQARATGERP